MGRGSASRGRPHRSVVVDGFEILIGRGEEENDALTFGVAEPHDFWLHVSGFAGSHVIVRNPDRLVQIPLPVLQRAAELAAWHSKARGARGKVEVHLCRAGDVTKPRRSPPGLVELRTFQALKVYARAGEGGAD